MNNTDLIKTFAKRSGVTEAAAKKQVLKALKAKSFRGVEPSKTRKAIAQLQGSQAPLMFQGFGNLTVQQLPPADRTIVTQVVSQAVEQAKDLGATPTQVKAVREKGKKRAVKAVAQQSAVGATQTQKKVAAQVAVAPVVAAEVKKRGGTRTRSASSSDAPKRRKLSEAKTKRARELTKAIKAGLIPAKQGLTSYSEVKSGKPREKLNAFLDLYKGVRAPKEGSIAAKYAKIKGAKRPYYVAPSLKTVRVKDAPGRILAIPGSGAEPFSKLSDSQKMAVSAFLNTEAGKTLRAPYAPKKAPTNLERQSVKSANRKAGAAKRSKRSSSRAKKGAANWW